MFTPNDLVENYSVLIDLVVEAMLRADEIPSEPPPVQEDENQQHAKHAPAG